jgi:mono/diheme cytochrome c family protein
MLPGTEALSVKYKGEIPAVLEHRSGLTKEVIAVFVRQGSWSMPPFRQTELSDDEIADIAAYLSVSSRQAAARR